MGTIMVETRNLLLLFICFFSFFRSVASLLASLLASSLLACLLACSVSELRLILVLRMLLDEARQTTSGSSSYFLLNLKQNGSDDTAEFVVMKMSDEIAFTKPVQPRRYPVHPSAWAKRNYELQIEQLRKFHTCPSPQIELISVTVNLSVSEGKLCLNFVMNFLSLDQIFRFPVRRALINID